MSAGRCPATSAGARTRRRVAAVLLLVCGWTALATSWSFAPGRRSPSLANGTLGRPLAAAAVLPPAPPSVVPPARVLPAFVPIGTELIGTELMLPGSAAPVPVGAVPQATFDSPQAMVDSPQATFDSPQAMVDSAVSVVASFQPRSLVLPGGITAVVIGIGVRPDGELAVPDDPGTVGWWNAGARPGDPFGSVVVAGHVDSARYGLGVMAKLRDLRLGQIVELTADGWRQRYRVARTLRVPQSEIVRRAAAFRQDVPARLVMITCGGAFDRRRHRYQDNLLLFADPVR